MLADNCVSIIQFLLLLGVAVVQLMLDTIGGHPSETSPLFIGLSLLIIFSYYLSLH